jgi:hypothetical protein
MALLSAVALLLRPPSIHAAPPALPDCDSWWRQESSYPSCKLAPVVFSPAQSQAGFESRKDRLLDFWVARDLSQDQYAQRALADLYTDRWTAEAQAALQDTARGRLVIDPDFAALKLCRAYYLFAPRGALQPATIEAIRRFFLTTDFRSRWNEAAGQAAENHEFQFHTARFLGAQAFPDQHFQAYAAGGQELCRQDARWLKAAIRFRAEQGWGEFASAVYYRVDIECLLCLYDFSRDRELRRLSGMMLNVLLAEIAVNSCAGMYGGAHGRIYYWDALKHSTEDTYGLQYLYFGNADPRTIGGLSGSVDALTSSFRPGDVVVEVALDRNEPYENRQRNCLHKPDDVQPREPLSGSIRRYSYCTPDYVLGCVQFQAPYPEAYPGKFYAHHEQHEWDLTFAARLRSRIFTHHPGQGNNEHGRWTGDMLCGCGHFFQNKTALVALYDIPPREPCQFIHAFVPRRDFDELVEENDFIFVRAGQTYAALKMLGGCQWSSEPIWRNAEIISHGARNGAICEVGQEADFGGFEAFRREISANEIHFDRHTMELSYRSRRAGKLYLNTHGVRLLNDQPAALDYATYDCPYLRSAWKSGIVEIIHGKKVLRMDFHSPDP